VTKAQIFNAHAFQAQASKSERANLLESKSQEYRDNAARATERRDHAMSELARERETHLERSWQQLADTSQWLSEQERRDHQRDKSSKI
jgi:hypothetical protein